MGRLKNMRFISTILVLLMMISLLPTNIVKAAGLVKITPDLNGSTESNPVVVSGLRPEITIELEPDTQVYTTVLKKLPGTSNIAKEFDINTDDVTNLTITPKNDLEEDATYYINLATNAGGYSEYRFYFKPSLALASQEIITSPTDGTINVEVNVNPEITFSEAVEESTLTAENIALYKGSTKISALLGDYNQKDLKISLLPAQNLEYNTEYSIKVTGVNKASGATFEDYTATFTTRDIPTTIVDITPAENAEDVPVNSKIVVTFSRPISDMIIKDKFSVKEGGVAINSKDLNVTLSSDKTQVTIYKKDKMTALVNWAYETNIEVTAIDDIYDENNQKIDSGKTWSFTTQAKDVVKPEIEYIRVNSTEMDISSVEERPTVNLPSKLTFELKYSEPISKSALDRVSIKENRVGNNGVFYQNIKTSEGGANAFSAKFNDTRDTITLTVTKALESGEIYMLSSEVWDSGMNYCDDTSFYFMIKDYDSPTITKVSPEHNASQVKVNEEIKVTFSEMMDDTTLTKDSVALFKGDINVAESVTYNRQLNVATINTASDLEDGTEYTIKVSTDVKDMSGNAMAAKYTSTFTTKGVIVVSDEAPVIVSVQPVENAVNVPISTPINITFSQPISKDGDLDNGCAGAIYLEDVIVVKKNGDVIPHGLHGIEVDISANLRTIIVNMNTNTDEWDKNSTYEVTVSGDIIGTNGKKLESGKTWTFKTESDGVVISDVTPPTVDSVNPVNGSADVAVDSNITVTFSEAMDDTTISTSSIKLMDGTNEVAASVSYNASTNTATLNPDADLENGTDYTVKVIATVKDVAGNALEAEFTSSFTTVEEPQITMPKVISTNPTNGQSDVAVNTVIKVTFNKDMDVTTEGIMNSFAMGLMNETDGTEVSISKQYDAETKTLTLKPSTLLLEGKLYKVWLGLGYFKDLDGNLIESNNGGATYDIVFSTRSEEDIMPPVVESCNITEGETGVATDIVITVTLNEDVDETTVNNNVVLDEKINSWTFNEVSSVVNYDKTTRTITIEPFTSLKEFTDYRVHLNSGLTDLAGNPMKETVINFKTLTTDLAGPKIISTNIKDGETGVLPETKFEVTFDEAIKHTYETGYMLKENIEVKKDGEVVDISNWSIGTTTDSGYKVVSIPGSYSKTKWEKGATYEITIKGGIVDEYYNEKGTVETYTFSIVENDTTAPEMLSMTPELRGSTYENPRAIATSLKPRFTVTFNEELLDYNLIGDYSGTGLYYTRDGSIWERVQIPVLGSDWKTKSGYEVTYNDSDTNNTVVTIRSLKQLEKDVVYKLSINAIDLQYNGIENKDYYFKIIDASSDTTKPIVTNVSPKNEALEVSEKVNPLITFSEEMKAETINSTNIELYNGTEKIASTVSYDNGTNIATITPNADLEFETTYTIKVGNEVADLVGNKLETEFSSIFTTRSNPVNDVTAPTITNVIPEDGATEISVDTHVMVEFSEAMDVTTINSDNIKLIDETSEIAASISYNTTTNTATINPDEELQYEKTYTVKVGIGVTDEIGNALEAGYTSSFTTGVDTASIMPKVVSTNPTNGQSDVAVDTVIKIIFNKDMDATTDGIMSSYAMGLNNNTDISTVDISKDYNASTRTLTITPKQALVEGKLYKLWLGLGYFKDLDGNSIESNNNGYTYDIVFSTIGAGDLIPPVVESSNITNKETGVATDIVATIVFNEDINEASLKGNAIIEEKTGMWDYDEITTSIKYDSSTKTLTITPNNTLKEYTDYRVYLKSGIMDLADNLMTETVIEFKTLTSDVTGPKIVSTNIKDGETGVLPETKFQVTFNEAIDNVYDEGHKPIENVEVKKDGEVIDISSWSIGLTYSSGNKTLFIPGEYSYNKWEKGSTYEITIKGGLVDKYYNEKGTDDTYTFSIVEDDTTAPELLSMTPDLRGSTYQNPKAIVSADNKPSFTATFNEELLKYNLIGDYSNTGLYYTHDGEYWERVQLPKPGSSWDTISGYVTSYDDSDPNNTIVTVKSLKDLGKGVVYKLAINAVDLQYNTVDNTEFYFVIKEGVVSDEIAPTIENVSPANEAIGISKDVQPKVTFSEAMDVATINSTNIGLYKGEEKIEATVNYDVLKNIATIVPDTELEIETMYTIKVGTGVTDIAGNVIEDEYISKFTTESEIIVSEKPEIESVTAYDLEGNLISIVNGTTDVKDILNKIEIQFNKEMDEETIAKNFSEYITIRDLSEEPENVYTSLEVLTENGKTKVTITAFFGVGNIELRPETEYAIVFAERVADKEGSKLSDSETLIKFTTAKSNRVKNTLLDAFIEGKSIMNGTTIVTPVEVNISEESQIIAFFNNELSDVNLEDNGLIRIWEQNETAYGKLISLPENAYSIEGNKYLIDISDELLDTDKVYKIVFADYIMDINGEILDKRYELFFKPVIKAISPDGMLTIEGDNIIKEGEESTLTVKSDIDSFAKLSFEVDYDINELSATSVELSAELAGLNASVEILKENDKEIGVIRFTADLDEDMMISNLFDVTFKSLNGEVTEVSINDINCNDSADMPIHIGSEMLKISGFTYDLNLDSKVNILDVIMVTRTIGLTSESEEWSSYSSRDINEDGKITEADADIIKSKMTSNN